MTEWDYSVIDSALNCRSKNPDFHIYSTLSSAAIASRGWACGGGGRSALPGKIVSL